MEVITGLGVGNRRSRRPGSRSGVTRQRQRHLAREALPAISCAPDLQRRSQGQGPAYLSETPRGSQHCSHHEPAGTRLSPSRGRCTQVHFVMGLETSSPWDTKDHASVSPLPGTRSLWPSVDGQKGLPLQNADCVVGPAHPTPGMMRGWETPACLVLFAALQPVSHPHSLFLNACCV